VAVDSARSIGVPILKFVGLPFRRYDALPLSALVGVVTLIIDLLTLKLVRIIVREVSKLPTNFGVLGTFRSLLLGQHLSRARCAECIYKVVQQHDLGDVARQIPCLCKETS